MRLVVTRLVRRLRAQAAPGPTLSQVSLLSALERQGPLSLGRLAALEGIRPPAASRLVDSLERAGLAARSGAVGRDRRVVLVEATERGRRLLGERRHGLDAHLAGRLALFSPAERALLAAAVDLLERLLEEKE